MRKVAAAVSNTINTTPFATRFARRSVRTAVAFQDQSALRDHLRYKVFFGGGEKSTRGAGSLPLLTLPSASMMISLLYLSLESGGCVFSRFDVPTAKMLDACDGIKGPNYAVGMHLSCIFIYSVYFGPFNNISIPQLVRLEMTNMQRIEGFVFGFASVCALFLFGAKRPNVRLPVLYENIMLSIYVSWFVIYCLELFHVFNILKAQKRRKLDITAEVAEEVQAVKKELKDIELHPTHHLVRDRKGSIVATTGKRSSTKSSSRSVSTARSNLARSHTAGAIMSKDSELLRDTLTNSERGTCGNNVRGPAFKEDDDDGDDDFFGRR